MHVLCGLRREQTVQCVPELRRRIHRPPDPACDRATARRMRGKTYAIRQACASEIQPRRRRSTFGEAAQYSSRGSLARRRDRALDFTKPDAVAVALAPAAHHERIAVFEERTLDAA